VLEEELLTQYDVGRTHVLEVEGVLDEDKLSTLLDEDAE
jgi:hypothetical protein